MNSTQYLKQAVETLATHGHRGNMALLKAFQAANGALQDTFTNDAAKHPENAAFVQICHDIAAAATVDAVIEGLKTFQPGAMWFEETAANAFKGLVISHVEVVIECNSVKRPAAVPHEKQRLALKDAPNVDLTAEQSASLGRYTYMHEATRHDGARLYTRVTYNHSTRGTWKAYLVEGDKKPVSLHQIPRIRLTSKHWHLTEYGRLVREEGRS